MFDNCELGSKTKIYDLEDGNKCIISYTKLKKD